MSTQDTAALIESVNNMTATVAGKMGEIDNKVVELENSVPNTVKGMMNITCYVDGINGNDSNSGLSSSPLKTINSALGKGVSGSTINIKLMCGQVHNIGTSSKFITNQIINFDPWGNDTLPEIAFSCNGSGVVHALYISQTSIAFRGVKVSHPYRDGIGDNAARDGQINSLFTSQSSNVSFDYSIIGGVFTRAIIDLGGNTNNKSALLSFERTNSVLNINSTDIVGDAGEVTRFRTNGSGILRVASVGKDAGILYYPAGTTVTQTDLLSNV